MCECNRIDGIAGEGHVWHPMSSFRWFYRDGQKIDSYLGAEVDTPTGWYYVDGVKVDAKARSSGPPLAEGDRHGQIWAIERGILAKRVADKWPTLGKADLVRFSLPCFRAR